MSRSTPCAFLVPACGAVTTAPLVANVNVSSIDVTDNDGEPVIIFDDTIVLPSDARAGTVSLTAALERTRPGWFRLRLDLTPEAGHAGTPVQLTASASTSATAGQLFTVARTQATQRLNRRLRATLTLTTQGEYDTRNVQTVSIPEEEIRVYGSTVFQTGTWVNISNVQGIDGINGILQVGSSGPGWLKPQGAVAWTGEYVTGGIVLPNNVADVAFAGSLMTVTTTFPHGLLLLDSVAVRNVLFDDDPAVNVTGVIVGVAASTFTLVLDGPVPTSAYMVRSGYWSPAGDTLCSTDRSRFPDEGITLSILGVQ